MKEQLGIGLLALNPQEDVIDVIRKNLLSYHSEIDVLVLPELFNSGFNKDEDFIIRQASRNKVVLERLRLFATEYNVAIAGSLLWGENAQFTNRGFIIDNQGYVTLYDKRHLFCKSPESQLLEGGVERPPVVSIQGWKVCLVVCYDLRFPVWCRQPGVDNMYDLLLVVANWPVVRDYAWNQLLIARAIENQAYVAGVNRQGDDEYGHYPIEMTRLYDSKGKSVELMRDGDLLIGKISLDELKRHRLHWPLINDADRYEVKLL